MPIFNSLPTAFTTPAPGVFGVTAVTNPTNTGHDSTCANTAPGSEDVGVSIEWRAFQLPPGPVISMTLKMNWQNDGFSSGAIPSFYELDYSLDNGSSWIPGVVDSNVDGPGSGSFSVGISASQNISLIRIRHLGLASVADPFSESAAICIDADSVRLEILFAEATKPILVC